MKRQLKALLLIGVLAMISQASIAQEKLEAYGVPLNSFPTPPFLESATAIINYNLDYMELNPGPNILHHDNRRDIKLYMFFREKQQIYSLRAVQGDTVVLPMRIQQSEDTDGCLFALIGDDWVNTICSDHFRYDAKAHIKSYQPKPKDVARKIDETEAKEIESAMLKKIAEFERMEQEAEKTKNKKRRKKKKKKNKKVERPF